jgi:hypothetical protein
MKETTATIKFICDNCKNSEECIPDSAGKINYPYEKGWLYIYQMNFQVEDDSKKHPRRIAVNDKHFCKATCFLTFIANSLANGGKSND